MTKQQINKIYFDKYIKISKKWNYEARDWDYDVIAVYKNIHENTTLGQDVGTALEYCR